MTTFSVVLKTQAGISRVKITARNIAEARELSRIQWGAAVQDVTINPAAN